MGWPGEPCPSLLVLGTACHRDPSCGAVGGWQPARPGTKSDIRNGIAGSILQFMGPFVSDDSLNNLAGLAFRQPLGVDPVDDEWRFLTPECVNTVTNLYASGRGNDSRPDD
jgi:hypothetical protein